MTDNPYSTPLLVTPPEDTCAEPASPPSLASIAKQTFLAWERMRIIYVIILGSFTLLIAGHNIAKIEALLVIAAGAIFANVCYFAGPITETYVRWLGYDHQWVRWFFFVGGTVITAILAFATLETMVLPL